MVMLEPEFVYGMVRKAFLLGIAFAAAAFFGLSADVAAAILIGTLVSTINLRVMAWSIRKMFDAIKEGRGNSTWYALLLVAKMLLLIAAIWVLIAYADVDPMGFAFGFSLFMPAIGWQMWASRSDESDMTSDDQQAE